MFTTTPVPLEIFQWKILNISSDKFFVQLKSVSQVVSLDASLLNEMNEVVEIKKSVLDNSEVVLGFENLISGWFIQLKQMLIGVTSKI